MGDVDWEMEDEDNTLTPNPQKYNPSQNQKIKLTKGISQKKPMEYISFHGLLFHFLY